MIAQTLKPLAVASEAQGLLWVGFPLAPKGMGGAQLIVGGQFFEVCGANLQQSIGKGPRRQAVF